MSESTPANTPGISITHPDGAVEWLYKPTPKQQEFHAATQPNVLYVGSRGTGKSVALRWEGHMRALATPGWKGVILRRTFPELSKSHLLFIEAEMKKLGGTYHKTERVASYPNGSKLFFSHCETDQDVLNLLSAEFYWMGFDEISTFPWEMILKLAASVRASKELGIAALVRGCTNPLGVSADDLYRYYVLKDVEPEEDAEYDPDDWHAIFTVLTDNPYLDHAEYTKRLSNLPAHVKTAWLDGQFTTERALFDFHPTKDGKPYHVIDEIPSIDGVSILKLPWVKFYRAYDHGFWPDPAVCLWCAVIGKLVIVFKEKYWYRTIAKDIAEDIVRESEGLNVITTYCDPVLDINTGADIVTMRDTFENNGVPMEPSINNREFYAHAIHSALQEEIAPGIPRVQMVKAGGASGYGVPYLIKYLPQMKYDEKHPLRMADHKHDHAPVALAYFLISNIPNTKPAEPKAVPLWMQHHTKDRRVLGAEGVRRRF